MDEAFETGEINLAALPDYISSLDSAIAEAVDGSDAADVYVDCRGVIFRNIDTVRTLFEATRYAAERGRRVVIRNLPAPSDRLLRTCDRRNELAIESCAVGIHRTYPPLGRISRYSS